jgi:hypothetical protein
VKISRDKSLLRLDIWLLKTEGSREEVLRKMVRSRQTSRRANIQKRLFKLQSTRNSVYFLAVELYRSQSRSASTNPSTARISQTKHTIRPIAHAQKPTQQVLAQKP